MKACSTTHPALLRAASPPRPRGAPLPPAPTPALACASIPDSAGGPPPLAGPLPNASGQPVSLQRDSPFPTAALTDGDDDRAAGDSAGDLLPSLDSYPPPDRAPAARIHLPHARQLRRTATTTERPPPPRVPDARLAYADCSFLPENELDDADSRQKLVAGFLEGFPGQVDGKLRKARMNHPKGFTINDMVLSVLCASYVGHLFFARHVLYWQQLLPSGDKQRNSSNLGGTAPFL